MATTKNYLDYSGLSKYNELLKAFVANTYVAKEDGRSLMTTEQANKLAGIAEGAQVNVIESISVKGKGDPSASPLTVTGKGVTLDISAYALSSEVTTETDRASSAETALDGRIDAIFTPAHDTTPASGSVVTYVNEKITDVNDAANTLAGKVTANENAITLLNGSKDTKGSVANTVTNEIAKVVAKAPEAFDTLKEIADWIGSGAVENTTAANMLADINMLKGEETVKGSVAKALKDAKIYADGLNTTTNSTIAAEKSRAIAAEEALDERLDVIEGGETVEGSVAKALKDAKAHTDGKIGTIPAQVGQTPTSTVVKYVDAKVLAEQTRADDEEKKLAGRLAAIETSIGSGDKSMHERVSALETTVGNESSGLVKKVNDNATAISTVDGKVKSLNTAYKAADDNLMAEINAIQPIQLTGENSIASLFPTAQA